MYRLISATPSPYARKVRIALAEEKLPVLLLPDGSSVYESRFILEYLEIKHPLPRLLPDDADGILAAKRLEVLCDGVCDAAVLTFFERRRAPEHRSAPWLARQRRKIEGGMREIARLVGGRSWAVGERFSLGDIAAGTVAGYLGVRFPEFEWRAQYPAFAAYFDRLALRPSFAATVPVPQQIGSQVV